MTDLNKTTRCVQRGLVALSLLALSACPPHPGSQADGGGIPDASVTRDLSRLPDLPAVDSAGGADQAGACPVGKIAFTQDAGCGNDGSNEFCVPKRDAATLIEVKRIAPTVTCGSGRGRAGCDPAHQELCFFPTNASTCTSLHGALTEAAWSQHCQLAALPTVPRIVHTFFE